MPFFPRPLAVTYEFVSINLTPLSISNKWNNTVFVFCDLTILASMLKHVSESPFLWLNNIPFYVCTITSSLNLLMLCSPFLRLYRL